jgi:hypothetical protein
MCDDRTNLRGHGNARAFNLCVMIAQSTDRRSLDSLVQHLHFIWPTPSNMLLHALPQLSINLPIFFEDCTHVSSKFMFRAAVSHAPM